LEPCSASIGGFAVRRLRYVKGLGEADWQSIAGARQIRQLASVDDVVLRTTLDEGVLGKLSKRVLAKVSVLIDVLRFGTCGACSYKGRIAFPAGA
jgi:hypothetical protein